MSIVGEDRLDDKNEEHNHRDDKSDEQSKIGGEAMEVIREISRGNYFFQLRRNILCQRITTRIKNIYIYSRRSSQNRETW